MQRRGGTPGRSALASEQPKKGSAKGSETPQAIAGCLGSLVTQEFVCPPWAAWVGEGTDCLHEDVEEASRSRGCLWSVKLLQLKAEARPHGCWTG